MSILCTDVDAQELFSISPKKFLKPFNLSHSEIDNLMNLPIDDIRFFSHLILIKKMKSIAISIKDKVQINQYYHLPHLINYREFMALCENLGDLIAEDDIKIDSKYSYEINRPDNIPFHTDAFEVDIVAWYCAVEEEGDDNDQSLLINMTDLREYFSDAELQDMSKIKINISKNYKNGSASLIKLADNDFNIYYHPWGYRKDSDCSGRKLEILYKKFQSYIETKRQTCIKIPLEKQQALFIDNKKILHGRNQINANSKRFLKRIWIARR